MQTYASLSRQRTWHSFFGFPQVRIFHFVIVTCCKLPSCASPGNSNKNAFSSPEPTILLQAGIESSGQFRNMCSRSEGAFLFQTPEFAWKSRDSRTQPELSIPAAGQKGRGLYENDKNVAQKKRLSKKVEISPLPQHRISLGYLALAT